MRTSGRTSAASVPSLAATRMISCTAASVATTCRTRGSSARARRSSSCSSATLSTSASVAIGSSDGYRLCAAVECQAWTWPLPPSRAIARAARAASSSARRHDLVGIREAGALARHRPHAHALLDAVAAFLDDAVLERPVLLARELEVQVARVHARAEHRIERLFEAPVVEAGGREDALARALQGVGHPITRCFSAGKLSRVAFCPSLSSVAVTTWLPRGSRASTRPQ